MPNLPARLARNLQLVDEILADHCDHDDGYVLCQWCHNTLARMEIVLRDAIREALEEAEKVVKEYEPDFTKGWPDDQRPYDEFAEKVIALARKNIAAALAALRGETP